MNQEMTVEAYSSPIGGSYQLMPSKREIVKQTVLARYSKDRLFLEKQAYGKTGLWKAHPWVQGETKAT